ncbi:Integral membrane protein [Penicillium hispanicum]|uniref:Integral membrane protein n=1 Tax=Penicillium hispanicum TaxID=1080232 RepID=UPI002540EF21|nr:Integral membrane protein [Penicillium hispanicum]KAJ5573841.1 Integral membrane protein [Penicillium hispanicum]
MNLLQLRDADLIRDDSSVVMSKRGSQGLAVSVIFTTLATAFVGARLYTRIKLIRRMEANDWMVVIALAFWLTIPFYNAAVLCAKASILMQYFHVFPTRRMRIVCWVMITILGLYGTWAVISAFLNCVPVAKFWNDSIPGFCLSKPGLWFSNASMHITTDLVILTIPIPALLAIDIPRKQRFALMVLFALGGFIVRLVALKTISDSTDPTSDDNVGAASWSAIECNTGIICACLPTLKPLISRLMPGLLSTFSKNRGTYGSGPMSTRRSGNWHDESTFVALGAPGEDHEYGAGDPERILALESGENFKYGGKRWSGGEKDQIMQNSSVTELTEQRHHYTSSQSSSPSYK